MSNRPREMCPCCNGTGEVASVLQCPVTFAGQNANCIALGCGEKCRSLGTGKLTRTMADVARDGKNTRR